MQITQRPSPNRGLGRQGHTPDFIVIHTTGGSFTSAINTILNPANQVSYHFVISRDGEIVQAVDIENMAWANGTTNSGDNRDNRHSAVPTIAERRINANFYTVSIGLGDMPAGNPSARQLDALVWLINHIRNEIERIFNYTIPATRERIIGHNQVTPRTRPDCPGRAFPFDEVVVGLGLAPTAPAVPIVPAEPSVPVEPAVPTEPQIPSWAIEALEWATTNGITDGSRPLEPATRAEAITFLYRLFGLVENKQTDTLPIIENTTTTLEPPPREPLTLTDFELDALCKIVWAEARGEDELGQRLIVHVVRNRLASPNFPNTLLEVLFQQNQFAPITNGQFNQATPNEIIYANVQQALAEPDQALAEPDQAQGALFFHSNTQTPSWKNRANVNFIFAQGNHRFYK